MREAITVGDQVFIADGDEVFDAVRQVAPHGRPELVIYIENAGDGSVSKMEMTFLGL
jgi:hypothetical protein